MKIRLESELCSGCGACVQICPNHCIQMQRNEEGFLYPRIAADVCNRCGSCARTCYLLQKENNVSRKRGEAFAAYLKDFAIRGRSSSGGVFHALAQSVLRQGGVVFGASFDEKFQVFHKAVFSVEELGELYGSKYVQSDTKETFIEVKRELEAGRTVLYSGTPCQLMGLRGYLQKEYNNLICVGVICHGVPSPEVWERYLCLKKGQYAEKNIKEVNFRDKADGWRYFSLRIKFENSEYRESLNKDLYMRGFLQNLFLRKSCYQCRAKKGSQSADIILGDHWGIDFKHSEMNDDKGISCVVVCTEKGSFWWNKVEREFVSQEIDYQEILESNPSIEKSVAWNKQRDSFFRELRMTGLLEESIRNHLHPDVITKEIRAAVQYPVILKYLRQKIDKRNIIETLMSWNWKKIALYAVSDLMELFLADLEADGRVAVRYLCDRNYKNLMRNKEDSIAKRLIGPKELAGRINGGDVDGIVICHPIRENEIFEELAGLGVEMKKMVSVVSLIFG